MEINYGDEVVPRFDLRINLSISEMIDLAQKPFETAKDQHYLSKQQLELFNFETDCFCKAT